MAEQTLKEKTAKGLFWGGLSNGVQQVLNLVFGLILARILNASDYGMVGMLAIFSAIASTIQESGFTAALTNQKKIRHEDYNAVFWFSTLTGVLFYVILFFCAPLIASFYNKPELIGLSRVVFLGFLFGGFGIASNAYLFKTLMVKERAKIDIISLVCSGVVGVAFALNGFAYYGLAIQTIIYISVSSLLKFIYAPWKPSFLISWQPLKLMFSFSSKLILTNIFTQISNNIFSVILGKFYSPQRLGYYSQGQKWMGMGHSLINGMVNNVAQPILVQVLDDRERQLNVFRKMVRFGAFLSFPVMFGLAFVSSEFIVILLGNKWEPVSPYLQLFCVWGAVGYLWNLYSNLLMTHGKSTLYMYATFFMCVCQLLIALALVPMGVYVMLIGYVISCYVSLLLLHLFVNRVLPYSLYKLIFDIGVYFCSAFIALCISWLVVHNMCNIYMIFCFKIVIFTIAYILVLWSGGSVLLKETILFIIKRNN